ncbi:Werner helicase interacting protein 1 [Mortierella sp. GBA30]|nr:Werner helicase interacting protein 1 [Mortierella sp. GBA30]
MNPFSTPKAKRTASSNATLQKQASSSSPASSLVPCPICEKKIPEWFVNNHLDNECSGMENVMESQPQQSSNKRKHVDTTIEFDDIDISDPFFESAVTNKDKDHGKSYLHASGSASAEHHQNHHQAPIMSRKDKANAAVLRSMPLAERARPTTLDDYIGQKELVGPGGMLRALVLQDTVPSIILWGPCGVGKTTLARIIANTTKAHFKEMGATTHGVADVSHRFTKAQQDIFLPFVEKGTITLIGATTENPSFRINGALLSRCRVLTLEKLSLEDGMDRMIRRAARIKWRDILELAQERMTPTEADTLMTTIAKNDETIDEWIEKTIEPGAIKWLIDLSDGDVKEEDASRTEKRGSMLERLNAAKLTAESVKSAFQKTHLQYDRQGDEHYNLISALHKSIRGGDADAALYWLGRMLVAGEEPLYVARRMIRLASEDIGLADSSALPLAVATYQACQMIGMPECDVNLAHCVAYMAKAKKSVDVYQAYGSVKQTVSEEYAFPVPIHLRNAPTQLMKDLGYAEGYKYPPDYPEGTKIDQEYLPKGLKKRKFLGEFRPTMKIDGDTEWHY